MTPPNLALTLALPLVPERPAAAPPQWLDDERVWVLTRHADVARLLEAPDTAAVEIHLGIETIGRRANRDYASLVLLLSGVLMFRNPPEHTAGRLWLAQCMATLMPRLTPARIADLIAGTVDPLEGLVDAVTALAERIPVLVLADAMGLGADTVAVLHANGRGVIEGWRRAMSLRVYAQLQTQAAAIETALAAEIAAARRDGGPLKTLIDLAPGLNDRDIIAGLFFLIMAGIETTAGLLGSVLWFALSQSHMAARLGQDVSPQAFVDETLRLAPPFRRTPARRLLTAMRFGDSELPAGSLVVTDLAAAHRDPEAFARSAEFRPGRQEARLLVFGAGAHACLGNHLARLEARLLLQAVLAREVRLADEIPDWDDNITVCRLRRLNLHFEPRKDLTT